MLVEIEIERHAPLVHGTDGQVLFLCTPHSSFSSSSSPEKADSAFESSPGGRKLHFPLAYKTKQDKEVIRGSSHIFLFLSYLALSVRITWTNRAFFFFFLTTRQSAKPRQRGILQILREIFSFRPWVKVHMDVVFCLCTKAHSRRSILTLRLSAGTGSAVRNPIHRTYPWGTEYRKGNGNTPGKLLEPAATNAGSRLEPPNSPESTKSKGREVNTQGYVDLHCIRLRKQVLKINCGMVMRRIMWGGGM